MRSGNDAEGFVGLVAFGFAGMLSYELPIYAARLFGLEGQLNGAWASAFRDSQQSGIIFVVIYMVVGCAAWVLPLYWTIHHHRKIAFVAIAPLYPLAHLFSTLADRLNGARAERAHLLHLYRTEFKGQFQSFRQFSRYVERLGVDEGTLPPVGFSASADPYDDALTLLGLDRGCGKDELAKRFRDLMMRVHPDQAGPNDIARRLTEARKVILARKGW